MFKLINICVLMFLLFCSTNIFAEVSSSTALEDAMKSGVVKVDKVELYPSFADIHFYYDFVDNGLITLPLTFSRDSIMIDYVKSKGLLSSDSDIVNSEFTIPKYLKSEHSRIEKLKDELIQLRAEQEAYSSASKLTDMTNLNVVDFKAIDSLIKTVIRNKVEYTKKANSLLSIIVVKEQELKILTDDFNAKIPKDFFKSINIKFKGNGKVRVYFSVSSRMVSWKNVYNMDINSSNGELNIKHMISISQLTGIDWDSIMNVHTVNRGSVFYAELSPEILDFPAVEPRYRAQAEMATKMMAEEGLVEEYEDVNSINNIDVSSNIAEVMYTVKANLKSEQKMLLVPLESYSIKTKVNFELIPLHNSYAMITGHAESLPKYIFSGEAILAVDNVYMGKYNLPNYDIGSEITIPFGYSNRITAERKEMIAKDDNGLFKSNSERGYNIIVKNLFDSPKEVTIVDRIPYSANSDIKIKDVKITPKANEKNSGILNWIINLNKGESKDISVRFRIDYPKDKKIISR